ncbi:MAG: hypothetical protein HY934_08285 [Candidatus Firestonebacteria bacterium]|nr:hypothetical protein [Candidatus Firestonebacteria bacterium]
MLLDKLFETLEEEASRQSSELVKKAEIEANKIVEEAEEESRKLVKTHIEKMDMTLRGARASLQIEAELDRKRKIIEAKELHTTHVFTELEKSLKIFRDKSEEYKKVFKNLLLESLNEVRGTKIAIVVDKKDENLTKNILAELKLNHEVKVGESTMGGLLLEVDNKRIMVYNTFETRLDKAKKVLKTQLTEVLFGA